MKRILLFTFILSTVLLAACIGPALSIQSNDVVGEEVSVNESGVYTNITVDELSTMMEDKDFLLVNVHIPFSGDIINTDLSVPYNEIEANRAQLPSDKNAKIVLYCRGGSMSSNAAQTLTELGYTNVWNLRGGFNSWKEVGYPMEETNQ